MIPTLNTQVELENWLQQNPKGIVLYSGNNCPAVGQLHVIASYNERARLVPFLLCQHYLPQRLKNYIINALE